MNRHDEPGRAPRTILVTGGAGGLGAALARRLTAAGHIPGVTLSRVPAATPVTPQQDA